MAAQLICPRCGGPLRTSDRWPEWAKPCASCGLGFIARWENCPRCKQPTGAHGILCPPGAAVEVVRCPLCGGKRHRKDVQLSTLQCSYRQWAVAAGRVPGHTERVDGHDHWLMDDMQAELPDDKDAANQREYLAWRHKHADLPAGSVHAERILRQRARAQRREEPA